MQMLVHILLYQCACFLSLIVIVERFIFMHLFVKISVQRSGKNKQEQILLISFRNHQNLSTLFRCVQREEIREL